MEFAIRSALIWLGPVAGKSIARDNVEFAIRGSILDVFDRFSAIRGLNLGVFSRILALAHALVFLGDKYQLPGVNSQRAWESAAWSSSNLSCTSWS